jgi:hypothetical protein
MLFEIIQSGIGDSSLADYLIKHKKLYLFWGWRGKSVDILRALVNIACHRLIPLPFRGAQPFSLTLVLSNGEPLTLVVACPIVSDPPCL